MLTAILRLFLVRLVPKGLGQWIDNRWIEPKFPDGFAFCLQVYPTQAAYVFQEYVDHRYGLLIPIAEMSRRFETTEPDARSQTLRDLLWEHWKASKS